MSNDGNILGTRKYPEVQPSSSANLGITSASVKSDSAVHNNEEHPTDSAGAHAGIGAGARSTAGHSLGINLLKRQRSAGFGGVAAGKAEGENVVVGSTGDVPVDKLTPEQMRRYQAWKRSRLERSGVRELILDRAAPTLTRSLESGQGTGALKETSILVMSSMAKMYVGDLVEEAKRAQLSRGESGPLKPKDLLDARERLAISGAVPQLSSSSGRAPGVGGSARKSLLGGRSALMRRDAI